MTQFRVTLLLEAAEEYSTIDDVYAELEDVVNELPDFALLKIVVKELAGT